MTIGPIAITTTVIHTWIIVGALALFALVFHRHYRAWQPGMWQLAIEHIVEYVENLIIDTTGRSLPELVTYLTTMICFIGAANLLGLFPVLQAPTSNVNTTMALSLISLLSTYYFGLKYRGIRAQILSFFEPTPIMLPLNLIGQASRFLSMALRLFGNVIAGEIIGATMFMLFPLFGPLPLNLLGIVTGLLQSLVFTVLTIVFVVDAMRLE